MARLQPRLRTVTAGMRTTSTVHITTHIPEHGWTMDTVNKVEVYKRALQTLAGRIPSLVEKV